MSSTMSDQRMEKAVKLYRSMINLEAETTAYSCIDYLQAQGELSSTTGVPVVVNEVWRNKVCEWFYKVVDKSNGSLSREIVHIAMSILDRFISCTITGRVEMQYDARTFYQVAAMSSIYIAAKVHYRKGNENCIIAVQQGGDKLPLQELLKLSTAGIKESDILGMEGKILSALSWQICPPTPTLFARCLLALLPLSDVIGKEDKSAVYDQTRFLAELTCCDYFFVGYKASTIAYASILTALEEFQMGFEADQIERARQVVAFLTNMGPMSNTSPDASDVLAARSRIRQLYLRSSEGRHTVPVVSPEETRSTEIPRVVSSENLKAI